MLEKHSDSLSSGILAIIVQEIFIWGTQISLDFW